MRYPIQPMGRTRLAGLLVLLFMTACLPGLPTPSGEDNFEASPTATTTPTITPTIDWFPATPTPTLAPVPTREATPDLRPVLGEIIFKDNFSRKRGWQTLRTESASIAYGKNELTLAIEQSKTTLTSLRSEPLLTDFYMEITATPTLCRGSDAYGVLVRAQSNEDYYRFVVSCDGQLRLERILATRVAILQDWTPQASKPFAARLGVWVSGSSLSFYIDGIHQFSVREPTLTRGVVGVFARSTGSDALTVNFSDLVVWQVDPSAAVPSTPAPVSPTPLP